MEKTEENNSFKVTGLDQASMERCQRRWMQIAKPLYGLGRLEDAIIQIAGIIGNEKVSIDKKALIVMCADNGVVEEGVSQTDSSVTSVVTDNFAEGKTSACLMSRRAGVDVFPIDIGVQTKTKVYEDKVAWGTRNMAKGPAMSKEEAQGAIHAGIRAAWRCRELGYQILLTGEMGIGNTTTSSAVASVLLGLPPEKVTGKGAGLSDSGLRRKVEVIRQAIKVNTPNPSDPLDVVRKVGGFDIAGIMGAFLGGALYGVPVLADGFISCVAALCAVRACPLAKKAVFASHVSAEPAGHMVLEALGLEPLITARMRLGEGTGAVAAMPLFDMAAAVYRGMSTFSDIEIEEYKPL